MAGCEQADAAIVIVNHRTPDLVLALLESVERTRADLRLELVVVDNGSGDDSAARLRAGAPAARVLALEDNRGFAAGVNAGVAACTASTVLLLNPDTEVRPGALAALIDHLRSRPGVGVAAPLLVHPDGSPQRNGYRRLPTLLTLLVDFSIPLGYALEHAQALNPHALPVERLARGGPVAHVYGAALAIRRRAYEDAGPLDEGFFLYLEETEWQGRVGAAGWDIEIVPTATVMHMVRGGGEAGEVFSPHVVRSTYRYFELRGRPAWSIDLVLLLASLSSWTTLQLIALVPGKRARARRQARAYRWLAGAVRARRRGIV